MRDTNFSIVEIKNYSYQLRNMFDFLLLSMTLDKNIQKEDVYNFLCAMNVIIMKICKEFEK